MSDDLFWPPLSDGSEGGPIGGTGRGDEPVGEQPTEPVHYTAFSDQATASYPQHAAKPGRDHRWTGTATVAALAAFIFGAGGVAVGAAAFHGTNKNSSTNSDGFSVASVSDKGLASDPKSYAAIAAKLLPSVVSINVSGPNESDTGSGIVLRSDGYVLTNNHVVAAAANNGSVSVQFNDGSSASAKIVGTDQLDDLAVIKVNKSGLTPATLGDSTQLQVGDAVLAVGSPLGLSGTVTSGIVSALNRPVETQADDEQQQQNPFGFGGGSTQTQEPTVIDAIQTDAAINPGNSGGPLVNAAGQVVGVNSAIASLSDNSFGGSQSGSIGVGFAIPVDQAKTIAEELISTGHAVHPLLGVSLPPDAADGTAPKATVESIVNGGPADKAGIRKGDVITAVGDQQTPTSDSVIAAVRTHTPGEQVRVSFTRGGASHTVTVTLTQQSSQG